MTRLDKALVSRGLVSTRAKAQDAILDARVYVEDVLVIKNSFEVDDHMRIEVKEAAISFVSRAGFKLYDVLQPFALTIKDKVVIDVGASTGGFSDVCLREDARYVYAVDVGSDQLDASLLHHPRLCNMEQVNCRYLTPSMFSLPIDLCVCDVSFISLKLILPSVLACMKSKECILLIKPQFEAGKEHIGKHGIVKDKKVHVRVLEDLAQFFLSEHMYVHHITGCHLTGRDGNQEYVVHLLDTPTKHIYDYKKVVQNAFEKR